MQLDFAARQNDQSKQFFCKGQKHLRKTLRPPPNRYVYCSSYGARTDARLAIAKREAEVILDRMKIYRGSHNYLDHLYNIASCIAGQMFQIFFGPWAGTCDHQVIVGICCTICVFFVDRVTFIKRTSWQVMY